MSLFGSVDIALRGDTSNLDKALTNGQKKIDQFGKGKGADAGAGAGAWGAIASGLASVGSAALDAGKQLASFIADSMQGIAQLSQDAAMLGTTASSLAGWQHAAATVGVSAETMTAGLEKFQKHMAEAKQGNAEVLTSLNRLGIAFDKDLADKPLTEQVNTFADAMKRTGNEGDKLQSTLSLFGKGAAPLKEVLKQGSEGMQAMQEEAERLGIAVSQENAEQVNKAVKGWRLFQETIVGIGRSLAVIFAPMLEKITTGMNSASGVAEGLAKNIRFFQALVDVGFEIWKAWQNIQQTFMGFGPLLEGVGASAKTNGSSWSEWRDKILGGAWTAQFYLQRFSDYTTLWSARVALGTVQVANAFEACFTGVGKAWSALWDGIKSGDFSGVAEKVQDAFNDAMNRPETALEKKLKDRIKDKEEALKGDLDGWLAQKFAEFNKPFKPDQLPEKGTESDRVFAKPAAMEIGSKEAFSVLYGTESAQEKALAVANKQLDENKQMKKLLQRIAAQRFGVRAAKL